MSSQGKDIKDIIDSQEKKGGLNVSPLKPGTKLVVETQNSFYEIEVVEGKLVKLFGGTRRDGSTRFPSPVEAVIYGSTWGGSMIKVDWLGIDMRMEVYIRPSKKILLTSFIRKVTIESPEGGWSYTIT